MTVWVAASGDGGCLSVAVDAEESLGAGGCFDGVDCDADGAVHAVFEAYGHGEAGGHLAVGLGFGGARSDGGPGDEVGDVLGGDGVE